MANNEVGRIQVRIPPFWPEDPEVWFAQVENQFDLAKITTDDTKYSHVAGNLEARYAKEIRDVLTNPPPTGKYEKLKAELIRRLSVSQEHRTRQLLEHEEQGDRKPSQFLRHLQHLAGAAVPETLLRSLWMGRLPRNMQAILATQTKATLEEVAELADAISNTTTPVINEVNRGYDDALKTVMSEIAQLKTQLQNHDSDRRTRSRNRAKTSTSRDRRRSQSERKTYDTCWYHFKFGENARKCRPPCDKSNQGNPTGSQ